MPSSPSLIGRAILAVVLTLGLYVLALAIVGGLLYTPYAEWARRGDLNGRLIPYCLICAAIIVKALLSARDRFSPPGLLLDLHAQPRLFELLTEMAQATQQQLPSKVYLTAEMNAWVMHRGGIMGIGGHRVLGLGLPLLHVLNLAQLRVILAHEFGHFFRGDTTLGPWVYHTRAAIERILEGFRDYRTHRGLRRYWRWRPLLLDLPEFLFRCYGWAFLRITCAISRQQEFVADALAARSVGPRPLIEALQRIYSTGPAFDAYWQHQVVPILHRGFRPPLAAGFRHYLTVSHSMPAVAPCLDWELAEEETSLYDTHPTLRERIAALSRWPAIDSPEPDVPAFSLLEDVDLCETRLIEAISDATTATAFQPMEWEEVGPLLWIPLWKRTLQKYAHVLAGIPLRTLPALVQDTERFARRLATFDSRERTLEERRHHVLTTLGAALAVTLHTRGWEVHVLPGEDVCCQQQGALVKPFDIIVQLATGELTLEAWQKCCATLGIAELILAGGTLTAQGDATDPRGVHAKNMVMTSFKRVGPSAGSAGRCLGRRARLPAAPAPIPWPL